MDTVAADWLLEADPSIRWQVQCALLDSPDEVWRAEQEFPTSE